MKRDERLLHVTRSDVREALSAANATFSDCWSILVALRKQQIARLLDFQPLLATSILSLSRLYHAVRAEQRSLTARKLSTSQTFFAQRMSRAQRHAEAIHRAMQIARAMGDLFAWFCYQNDRDLLERHLAAAPGKDFPTGIGGIGEVSFIERAQNLDGQLVVYHGITNILRNGDISLVDLSSWRIASIAELKTTKTAEDKITIAVIGYRPGENRRLEEIRLPEFNVQTVDPQRLARQMTRIAQTFASRPFDANLNATGKLYFEELKKLARKFKHRRVAYVKASEGLLLVAFLRHRSHSLASRLLCERPFDPSFLQQAPAVAQELVLAGSTENAFLADTLDFSVDATWVPAFWAGLSPDLAWDVITHRASVWALYNPVFFLNKLRVAGVKVTRHQGGYSLLYATDGMKMRANDISSVLTSIRRRLLKEESAIQILLEPARRIASGECPPFRRLQVQLRQFLGTPPGE